MNTLVRHIQLLVCFFALYLIVPHTHAQSTSELCGTDQYHEAQLRENPGLAQRLANLEREYVEYVEAGGSATTRGGGSCDIHVIPVVVHVVYNSTNSNISDEQIHSQIEVLNEDYRRMYDTEGYGHGIDSYIQFCLANFDPNGNPTTGITRTESPVSDHDISNPSPLKSLIRWNTSRYLNMWIVNDISSSGQPGTILGYAQFPGGNPSTDGVVIRHTAFGRTGSVTSPSNRGRTATHEVGHYLGLAHPFQGGCTGTTQGNCLTQGDRICDTPAQDEPPYGCPSLFLNTCTDAPNNLPDPVKNYMNYVNDACMNQFTPGQLDRMEFYLNGTRSQLVSTSNLASVGCDTVQAIIAKPTAKFSSSVSTACPGTLISYTDESDGCVDSWSWVFPGGTPITSTDPNPVVSYTTPGTYPVNLTVTNSVDSDVVTKNNYIQISGNPAEPPIMEGFEATTFVPSDWKIEDEDAAGGWNSTISAASEGVASAVVSNYTLTDEPAIGSEDNLLLPTLNLQTVSQAFLTFDYAYKKHSDFREDILRVDLSLDCGNNFTVNLFNKAGGDLATVAGEQSNEAYIPDAGDWRTETIDLTPYAGQGLIRIRFQNIGLGGQNVYLDNINLSTAVSIEEDLGIIDEFQVIPNPFTDAVSVELGLTEGSPVEIEILDLSGRSLGRQSYAYQLAGAHRFELGSEILGGLASGMYFVTVRTDAGKASQKLIKQ